MATGVKPRDEESCLTRSDLETIQEAMKQKKFRELFTEFCEEVRDPANQALYQKEMTQLEKERGYDITFINPKGGYVIKTSVAGDRKAFINICSNENVGKPSCKVDEVKGQKGMNWQIPYSLIPPREDYSQKKERVIIYDVVFNPDTLRMAELNKRFRELVNKTAFDGLKKTYDINLDVNNLRFPKSNYKGITTPAVIRTEDPEFKPLSEEDTENISQEVLDKLYPQKTYAESEIKTKPQTSKVDKNHNKKVSTSGKVEQTSTGNRYTIPKYVIKQQKNVELQDFTYGKDSKHYIATPSHIVVEINLPLLSSTKNCILDVQEKSLLLTAEKPAKYRLQLNLPYSVNDELGTAKFDKSRHMLIVTLPVIRKNISSDCKNVRIDSGVESEESTSHSDEDQTLELVTELSSTPVVAPPSPQADLASINPKEEPFLNPDLGYILPPYTHNVLDDMIAFTFHVKNTEPDSIIVKNENHKVSIKFTSIGSGYVPVHYAAMLVFDEDIKFDNVSKEAWDNNVILQLELQGDVPKKFNIGLNTESMTCESLEVPQVSKKSKQESSPEFSSNESKPVVEVTNLGTETNIVVSANHSEVDEDDDDDDDEDDDDTTEVEREIVWTESERCDNGAKSILRKQGMMRSFSESSAGDIASSMDYVSSDCIPEESSLKKTVRFSNVIARQFYRYNSSIEGQKKKNQRKKSKKRGQDRRKSESEAEEDTASFNKNTKPRVKSNPKQRRDSGLADTSDTDGCRNTPDDSSFHTNTTDAQENTSCLNILNNDTAKSHPEIWESKENSKSNDKKTEPITSENLKHNTNLYNPEKLNKGQYLEVMFKNDLIFDLDM